MTNHEAEARPRRFIDQRGIALQTVIIMVVLLAIAGAIAAVLLSRASEVTGELESQDVTATRIDTEAECRNNTMTHGTDTSKNVTGDWTAGTTTCEWEDKTAGDNVVTAARCSLVGGTYTPGNKGKCVVT